MQYLKPFSIDTTFFVEIRGRNVQPFIDCVKGTLFEKIEIRRLSERQSSFDFKLSTTIQALNIQTINQKYIERIEQRFRNDFLSRISSFNDMVIDLKSTTSVKFTSSAFYLGRKSTKKNTMQKRKRFKVLTFELCPKKGQESRVVKIKESELLTIKIIKK